MSRTFEEVRALLATAFKKEKERLKSFGTKANSFDLANVVARYVLALMAESRYRELKLFKKKGLKTKKEGWTPVIEYIDDRMKATKSMSRAIRHLAEDADSKRPWQPRHEREYREHNKRFEKSSRHKSSKKKRNRSGE